MELSSSLFLPPRWDRSHFAAIITTSLRVILTQMLFSFFFVRHSINDIIAFRLSAGTRRRRLHPIVQLEVLL